MTVAKAIIPAAGLGTRMRSLAGDLPKELLEIGGKLLIAHAVEGIARSGIAREGRLLAVELVGWEFDAGNPEGCRAVTDFAAGQSDGSGN
jgi:CTP:molybdopterin cytidylyltransferase MocA